MKKEEVVKILKGFADVHWERLSKSDLEKVMNAFNDIDSLKCVINIQEIAANLAKKRGKEVARRVVSRFVENFFMAMR